MLRPRDVQPSSDQPRQPPRTGSYGPPGGPPEKTSTGRYELESMATHDDFWDSGSDELSREESESVLRRAAFSDAVAEAEQFREIMDSGSPLDTAPAVRRVSASPLVWSPGASTQTELIADRYLIRNPRDDLLGTGAKGVVYKAYDTRMGGRKVAVKLFFDAFGDLNDPELVEEEENRTQREIEIQADLTHPSIVTIYDRFESEHGSGVVLEFVDGETLEERIERMKVIPVGDAVRLTIELTKAVEFMHRQGFVHRDIKPGNVLITSDENLKLIDFGLSKRRKDVQPEPADVEDGSLTRRLKLSDDDIYRTQEGDIVGTPAYMAPEQAAGRLSEVDERSDVFGVGALLFHCLTGRPPVNKETIEETLDLVLRGEFPSSRSINGEIDPALDAIVKKALVKDREKRFQTAHALREQLLRFQDGVPLDPTVYREPLTLRLGRWMAAHRTLVAILILTIVVSVSVGGAYRVLNQARNESASQELLSKAERAASSWDFDRAQEVCDEILQIDPGSPGALRLLRLLTRYRPTLNALGDARRAMAAANAELDKRDKQARSPSRGESTPTARYDESRVETQFLLALQALKVVERGLRKLRSERDLRFKTLITRARLRAMIEEARGLVPVSIAAPLTESGPLGARVRLRLLDKQLQPLDRFLDFEPPNESTELPAPIIRRKVPLGWYLAEILYQDRVCRLPIVVERRRPVRIGPLPEPPLGMVYVPGCEGFRPGHRAHDNLKPVDVGPFFIQTREVTVRDYLVFLASLSSTGDNAAALRHKPYHWVDLTPPVSDAELDLPIQHVSLESARAYASWYSKVKGGNFRLPTEAEWQLAAGGARGERDYPYGRRYQKEWSWTESAGPDLTGAHERDRSVFGALDMGGNVSEWVEPPDGVGSRTFLAKGGSYKGPAPIWQRQIVKVASTIEIGFRCVQDAPPIDEWIPPGTSRTGGAAKPAGPGEGPGDRVGEAAGDSAD